MKLYKKILLSFFCSIFFWVVMYHIGGYKEVQKKLSFVQRFFLGGVSFILPYLLIGIWQDIKNKKDGEN